MKRISKCNLKELEEVLQNWRSRAAKIKKHYNSIQLSDSKKREKIKRILEELELRNMTIVMMICNKNIELRIAYQTHVFLDFIYKEDNIQISVNLEVVRHENIGKGVVRAFCKVNGEDCKRVCHASYPPVWDVKGRIVANWFNAVLEKTYQEQIKGQTFIIHKNC